MNTTVTAITPFWERMGDIASYPAKPAALMTVVLLAILRPLALLPGVGWMIGLAITVGLYKYAFEVLRDSANGRLAPPEGSLNVDEELGWGAVRLQAMFVIANFLTVAFLPLPLAIVVTIFIALGMPGAVMSYAMDENFWLALNPVNWLAVMTRLGWPYFLAVALIFLITLVSQEVVDVVTSVIPALIAIPVIYCITNYATIAAFHLMGYLIYQYHDILGYEPKEQAIMTRPTDPDQGAIDDAMELARDGETATAIEMLRGHIRERGGSDAVHQQYRKLLRQANDKAELLRHGQDYLPILIGMDKDKLAVELLRDCMEIDPNFGPNQADAVTRLAAKAAQLAYTPVALRLLQGFAKRFPKSQDIPANYMLAAKLLSERMGKDVEARALLNQIKAAFPQHELIPQIDSMLAMLDKVGSAAPKPA